MELVKEKVLGATILRESGFYSFLQPKYPELADYLTKIVKSKWNLFGLEYDRDYYKSDK